MASLSLAQISLWETSHIPITLEYTDVKDRMKPHWREWKIIQKVDFKTSSESDFLVHIDIMNQSIERVVEKESETYSPGTSKIREIEKIDGHQAYSSARCDLGCCGLTTYVSKNKNITVAIGGGTFCHPSEAPNYRASRKENIFKRMVSTFQFSKTAYIY